MNGSSPSPYAALTDDLDIEPPQKAKANCQYILHQPKTQSGALYNCYLMLSLVVYILHYIRLKQYLVTHSVRSESMDYVCAADHKT